MSSSHCVILLVRLEHHRGALVGVRHEAEEAVGLLLGDRRVSDLVDDDELAFLQIAQPEPRLAVDIGVVEHLDERLHLLERDRVPAVYREQPQAQRDHRLAQPWRAGEHDVAVRVEPVEVLQALDLGCRDAAFELAGVELVDGLDPRREVGGGVVALALAGEAALRLGRQHTIHPTDVDFTLCR